MPKKFIPIVTRDNRKTNAKGQLKALKKRLNKERYARRAEKLALQKAG